MKQAILFFLMGIFTINARASSGAAATMTFDVTQSPLAIIAVILFVIAYGFVMAEEFIHLRKSKPVLAAAGLIWILVAILAQSIDNGLTIMQQAIDHNLMEYASLFLFLLTAMTYVNAMTERNVFEALRAWLISKGFSYKKLFWITGIMAFFISPIADNLTTALLMGAVVLALSLIHI